MVFFLTECYGRLSRRLHIARAVRAFWLLLPAVMFASVAAAQSGMQQTDMVPVRNTLEKMQTKKTLVMGVRSGSGLLSYALGNGVFAGMHPDLCTQIVRRIAKKRDIRDLDIQYLSVTSHNRLQLMENGSLDMECGSTTNNRRRQERVAFALTTYVTAVRLAVKKNSGITSLKDLNGKTIATTTGTTSSQLLKRYRKKHGMSFRQVFGKDHTDSFLLLDSDRAQAFVMDDYILAGSISNARDPGEYRVLEEVLAVEPIAIMLPRGDKAFKQAVDNEIRAMFEDGSYLATYNKWFMRPVPPKDQSARTPMPEAVRVIMLRANDAPADLYTLPAR